MINKLIMAKGSAIILITFLILTLGAIAFVLMIWNQERNRNKSLILKLKRQNIPKKIYTFGSDTNHSALLSCPNNKKINLLSTTINLPNGQPCNNETTSQVYPTTQLKAYTSGKNNVNIDPSNWFSIISDPCPSSKVKMIHGSYTCN